MSPPSAEVEHELPVAWCLRNADLAVHKPRMKPTHPEGLNRRLLAKRSKLTVQLTEQRKIRPGNRRKHEEQTRRDQSDHSIAPILKRSLNLLWAEVGVVLADHRHQGIDVQHQTNTPGSILIAGLDGFHHNRASSLNDQVVSGWHLILNMVPSFSSQNAYGTSLS